MCIPTHDRAGKVKIASRPPLEGLEGFDPKMNYQGEKKTGSDGKEHWYRDGREYQLMKKTDTEMGKISNLITDMTIIGATDDELARAVRHSMVVIDAEKHHLDYKQSEKDNNIQALKQKYQIKVDENGKIKYGGASTLISRAKGEVTVDKRQGTPKPNLPGKEWYDPSRPDGALIYKKADDATYTVKKVDKKTGEVTEVTKKRTDKSNRMSETDDAMTLVSKYIDNQRYWYDDRAVEGFIHYCENELTLTDGSDLYLLDSFKLWAEQIFGWYYFIERSVFVPSETGSGGHYEMRRIKKRLTTKQYLIVARGAAKSMYASCLRARSSCG